MEYRVRQKREYRIAVELPVVVYGERNIPAITVNLSTSGMLLSTAGDIEVGRVFTVGLDFDDGHVKVQARANRREADRCYALSYVVLPGEVRDRIDRFVGEVQAERGGDDTIWDPGVGDSADAATADAPIDGEVPGSTIDLSNPFSTQVGTIQLPDGRLTIGADDSAGSGPLDDDPSPFGLPDDPEQAVASDEFATERHDASELERAESWGVPDEWSAQEREVAEAPESLAELDDQFERPDDAAEPDDVDLRPNGDELDMGELVPPAEQEREEPAEWGQASPVAGAAAWDGPVRESVRRTLGKKPPRPARTAMWIVFLAILTLVVLIFATGRQHDLIAKLGGRDDGPSNATPLPNVRTPAPTRPNDAPTKAAGSEATDVPSTSSSDVSSSSPPPMTGATVTPERRTSPTTTPPTTTPPTTTPPTTTPQARPSPPSQPPPRSTTSGAGAASSTGSGTSSTPGAPSKASQRAVAQVREGDELFQAGTWSIPADKSALGRYRAALASDPTNAGARDGIIKICRAYLRRGQEVAAGGDEKGARWRYVRALELLQTDGARYGLPDVEAIRAEIESAMAKLP